MAITTILRRSISSVLPFAVVRRAVERRNHHQYYSALFTALYQYGSSSSSTLSHKPCPRPFASTLLLLHFYSSSSSSSAEKETSCADDPLVRAVKSNIKSVEESADHEAKLEELLDGFPFKIVDKPGKEYILLRRVYQGELIKARVFLLDLNGKNHKCNDFRTFPMTVRVLKENGTSLRFRCEVFVNEITIHLLRVKNSETSSEDPHSIHAYKGPDFK